MRVIEFPEAERPDRSRAGRTGAAHPASPVPGQARRAAPADAPVAPVGTPAPAAVGGDTPAGRVVVANSDGTYRIAIAACLRAEGFAVQELHEAPARTSDVAALAGATADAALIGTDLFGDGTPEALARLRALRPNLPVAVVAASPDDGMEETALAAGAADFFDRARAPSIVAKRMRLLVAGARAAAPATDGGGETLTCGALALRLDSHRALWRGAEVPLTVTEFRIVRLLATSGAAGASYRAIYDMVHGSGFSAGDGPDGHRTNVRSLIRRIRAKLARRGAPADIVENLPGVGYRWRDTAFAGAADAHRTDPNEMGAVG